MTDRIPNLHPRRSWVAVVLGEMALIPLTKGQRAKVDTADLRLIESRTWSAWPHRSTWYARGWDPATQSVQYMHRAILDIAKGDRRQVDHVNGDGLDNRRANLRVATPSQNRGNVTKRRDNTSGYKGVTFHSQTGRWAAQMKRGDGRGPHIGLFDTPEEAARAYDRAAVDRWGEFARLNFP